LLLLLITAATVYFLGPKLFDVTTSLPSIALRTAWSLARGRLPPNPLSELSRHFSSSAQNATAPATAAVCAVAPFLCATLPDGSKTLAVWGRRRGLVGEPQVDVAQVARRLTKEGAFCNGSCLLFCAAAMGGTDARRCSFSFPVVEQSETREPSLRASPH
jgi:hypothetical protein